MVEIRRVAVLGAGTMGSGIAAQLANAGYPVLLLDMTREIAESARQALLSRRPAPLMSPEAVDLIEIGDFEADLRRLSECDWIIEVVVERLDIKHALFRKIEAVRRPDTLISSNTSGIPLAEMVAGMPESFASHFLITHFFNPPRYMGLLELVAGPETLPEATAVLARFCEVALGKEVVRAKDTPGFIGNRIGVAMLMVGLHKALELGLTPEEADAVAGRPMGFPGTGIFGLFDLIGIDVIDLICSNLKQQLAGDDPIRPYLEMPVALQQMLEQGLTGRKGPGGFYRQRKVDGKKVRETYDLATGEYRPFTPAELASASSHRLDELLAQNDRGGRYAAAVLSATLGYSAWLLPEIADDIRAIDTAMREGYSWRWGPFELIDRIGAGSLVERLGRDGQPVPELLARVASVGGSFYRGGQLSEPEFFQLDGRYQPVPLSAEAWSLAEVKRTAPRLFGNESATLWDIGDGVACLEFHSKMNALDDKIAEMFVRTRGAVERGFQALVIGNDGPNFSVGANIKFIVDHALAEDYDSIRSFIGSLQSGLMGLKYAPFPVVGAPLGMALGGGCEVVLHCNEVQAHAEFRGGLVELRVGLIPGGGGCKEMLLRRYRELGPERAEEAIAGAFDVIATGATSSSAAGARGLKILGEGDGISMNRRRVLADAKARALAMVDGYQPGDEAVLQLPGRNGMPAIEARIQEAIEQGRMSDYDGRVACGLGRILTGGDRKSPGPVTERQLLALELEVIIDLLHNKETKARIEHMLKTGKPLRN
ncbi:MAG: 3-hydroxyacyl-CoA dehydrogenase NAD-binding domain-containing protein [Gammaproteobacteria bacterium]|nr:3-hydroxyacyl-CoA dehydrogenase NAD-binding domain-containing protein [Gammaproteobacteria bacterium]